MFWGLLACHLVDALAAQYLGEASDVKARIGEASGASRGYAETRV